MEDEIHVCGEAQATLASRCLQQDFDDDASVPQACCMWNCRKPAHGTISPLGPKIGTFACREGVIQGRQAEHLPLLAGGRSLVSKSGCDRDG